MSEKAIYDRERSFRRLMAVVAGLDVWVDSGTLLALHRQGKLLEWDRDIDLSCWVSATDSVLARRCAFESLGYRVAVRRLAGVPYKIRLTPSLAQRRSGAMHVDISIYQHCGDWALSPGIYRYRPQTPVWEFPNLIGHGLREIALMAWLKAGSEKDLITRRPRIEMRLFTWCVPAHMFETLKLLGAVNGLQAPADVDRYLTFRYGDWRTPQRDWDYFNDDRSVLRYRPEMTLNGRGLPISTDDWEHRPIER